MKYSTHLAFIIATLIMGFLGWTWRYPYHIGWQGEMPVGYYRFQVVTYQTTDYGHKNNVGTFETLGNSNDFIAHITGLRKLNIDEDL